MELGPVHAVPLAEARERAAKARLLRYDNIDPIKERKSRDAVAHAEADRVATRARGATFAKLRKHSSERMKPRGRMLSTGAMI
jgi:hypothetical protein